MSGVWPAAVTMTIRAGGGSACLRMHASHAFAISCGGTAINELLKKPEPKRYFIARCPFGFCIQHKGRNLLRQLAVELEVSQSQRQTPNLRLRRCHHPCTVLR